MKFGHIIARLKPASFQTRAFLLLLAVSSILSLLLGSYVFSRMEDSLFLQIGGRALVQARQISVMPGVARAVAARDTTALRALIMPLKQQSDANYIVIGDSQGRHLFHSQPGIAIGRPMEGGDNAPVLQQGRAIVTQEKGTLGVSLRGKAPIHDVQGRIIGVVSVGYFQSRIEQWNRLQFMPFVMLLLTVLAILFFSAWLFTRSIKRQMFNLEPLEIARLMRLQDVVFESIYEGVMAIDRQWQLTAINRAARDMLELSPNSQPLLGVGLEQLVPDCSFLHAGDEDKKDEICVFNGVSVIASRVGIYIDGQLHGWVISFRRKDDISTLSLQLSQVKRYADNLRVIRHEHLNWISTVSGLLQIKAYDEVMKLVQSQSATHQKVLDYISMTFGNYQVCGLLIGKYYRAKELGIELAFESGCCLDALPNCLSDLEWMSIIGNLLDNAFDASQSGAQDAKQVVLYLSDVGEELIIEVADQGEGVDSAVRDRMFERGVSTRAGGDRGVGLYLVDSYVQQAGGTITVEKNIPHGAVFTIFVPKKRGEHA